ncbi:hypothetical protein [Streptomyces sp. NPDC004266]|uniref:hypothetical protein n=1 Tax=Streptomyces sp. NPDC004266 TaxID=3364693 RepID=UPI0036C69141
MHLSIRHRPVLTASSELVRAHGHDLEDLRLSVTEGFGPGADWCEVDEELHTITMGDAEIRLRPRPDTPAWHAEYFPAGWGSRFEHVPLERRTDIAAYVDRTYDLVEGLLQECDLRAAASEGGAVAVDRLVRTHIGLADERYAALDSLHSALLTPEGVLPDWALELIHIEAEGLNTTREWLTSAVVSYHHGTAGRRPVTIYGGVCFGFSEGAIDLVSPQPRLDGAR